MASSVLRQGQHYIECDICQSLVIFTCKRCAVNLCNACVEPHILIESKNGHEVTKYNKQKIEGGECLTHPQQQCSAFCKTCNIPLCVLCVLNKHREHGIVELSEKVDKLSDFITKENERLRTKRTELEGILEHVSKRLASLRRVYKQTKEKISSHAKNLHQEIDKAEKALHKDLYKLQEKHAGVLIKQKKEFEEICKKLKTLEQTVDSLENSKDVRGLMELKFELENQQIPTFIEETRPAFFQPIKFNESYTSSFGYIQELESQKLPFDDLTKEDQISSSGQVLSISEVLSTFNTEFPAKKENNNRLFDMIPLGDDKVWAGGANHELKLFDLQGCLHDTVAISDYGGYLTLHDGHVVYTDKKENNNRLFDMIPLGDDKVWAGGANHELKLFDLQGCLHDTVAISDYGGYLTLHDGHVVYTDRNDNTVKKVINGKVDTLFRTGEYNPSGITCTAAGDFLVCLQTTESKIVRYSTSGDVLEEIQYDSQYQPLFKDAVYVVENGNGDVCVADWGKKAVTVVNKFGIFRFSYTGNKASKEEFLPSSLTTDSMHYITITDIINDKIHMLDRDGRFLGYIIPDQGIQRPRAVCVIREGEIMVGECLTGMIKRIKYLQ